MSNDHPAPPPFTGEIELSRHARRRFRQRTGMPVRALRRAAHRAVTEGHDPHDLHPHVRDKLLKKIEPRNGAPNQGDIHVIKVFDGDIYLFALKPCGKFVLVTVLPTFDGSATHAPEHRQASAPELPKFRRGKARTRSHKRPKPKKAWHGQ